MGGFLVALGLAVLVWLATLAAFFGIGLPAGHAVAWLWTVLGG